jgi:hypothetical protein
MSQFGLFEDESDQHTRVLYMDRRGISIALRVRGHLSTVQIEEKQIVPLPPHFYRNSLAIAFIVLGDERCALLLSPDRIRA